MSCDILHPCLCLYAAHKHIAQCAPLFLGWLPCGGGQAALPKDFSEKDIAQTPSMFPPCIHHRLADS